MIDDGTAFDERQLSKWTLAQRRSAVRSFAILMRPELLAILGEEPSRVVERALRGVAERVGAGYRLQGGAPRNRGGYAPDQEQLAALLDAVGREPGLGGARNRAFFGLLAATGARVNALRLLGCSDCVVLPGGRLRLYLHEKGKREQREVELGPATAHDVLVYVEACSRWGVRHRWKDPVRLGGDGAVWRNAAGRRWGYGSVVQTLRAACTSAGLPHCSPHDLRRSFATHAASVLPRHVVALAGGWNGLDRLDDHYVQPRFSTILEKLAKTALHAEPSSELVHVLNAATPPVWRISTRTRESR
jgi:integrase